MAQGNGPIVVGVDGSAPSLVALEWAAEEATTKKLDLHVVVGWHMPLMLGMPLPLPSDFDPLDPAREVLEDVRLKFVGRYPDLVVKTHVVEGAAASCLLRTAQSVGASLLVVGARGHGEVAGLLIGSVSEKVATHAKCPVVVVRH
ncbi:MAG: universal stress protein [Acidimicrobiales bacterium]|jgi:nucleotide-binding universal stress UspA family protein